MLSKIKDYSIYFPALLIFSLFFSLQTNAKVSDGELKRMAMEMVKESHPECDIIFKRTNALPSDDSICMTRLNFSMDKELNRIYQEVMERYSVFPKQKNRIRKVQREWIKYRDEECIFEDFDGGWINKTGCQLYNTSLSIWYLKRLNSIQFDEKGIPQIKKVLKEYKRKVNPI